MQMFLSSSVAIRFFRFLQSVGFDYQGWQVFIIVKITLITSYMQLLIKFISILRE